MPMPSDTLGIERKDMPQIEKGDYDEFFAYLKSNDVDYSSENVHANSLKPIQKDFSLKGMIKAIRKKRIKKPLITSDDDYIIDGHHRWLSVMSTKPRSNMKIIRVNVPVMQLLQLVRDFPKTTYRDVY